MRISDWSSDVGSSDLIDVIAAGKAIDIDAAAEPDRILLGELPGGGIEEPVAAVEQPAGPLAVEQQRAGERRDGRRARASADRPVVDAAPGRPGDGRATRSEEQTSELQSLMRISYAFFCLTKK